MWTNEKAAEEQLSIADTFKHMYQLILDALEGDTAAAEAMFQRYLAGELPEELLSLSRRCVQQNQGGPSQLDGPTRSSQVPTTALPADGA
jgi:hypothetical protein